MNILRNATAAYMLQGEEDHHETVNDAKNEVYLKDAA